MEEVNDEEGGRCCVLEREMMVLWGKKKKPAVEKLFHFEMKGERVISKGNIITFSYLLLECCGGGRGEEGEHRGAFKSNNHP